MFGVLISILCTLVLLVAILLDEYSVIKTPGPMDAFVGRGDSPDPIYEALRSVGVLLVVSEHGSIFMDHVLRRLYFLSL
jgi:hypothetical protein